MYWTCRYNQVRVNFEVSVVVHEMKNNRLSRVILPDPVHVTSQVKVLPLHSLNVPACFIIREGPVCLVVLYSV